MLGTGAKSESVGGARVGGVVSVGDVGVASAGAAVAWGVAVAWGAAGAWGVVAERLDSLAKEAGSGRPRK